MENDTQDKTSEQPPSAPSGGVMDVQVKPPQAQAPGVPPLPASPSSASESSPPPDPALPSERLATEGIIAPPESEHHDPVPPTDHEAHRLLAAHTSHKNRPPLVAIIVAVVIALVLIGVTVFAYMSTRDTAHQQSDEHTPAEQEPQQTGATTTDVDGATEEVDSTLNAVDDNKDLPESDLTDQALGL